jgi:hypothetical protein
MASTVLAAAAGKQTMAKKTVMYIHGLESGPTGRKYQELKRAGFDVVSLRMPCDRRSIIKDPVILAALMMLVGSPVAIGLAVGTLYAIPTFAAVLLAAFASKHLYVRRLLRRGVAVQLAALRNNPHIVAIVGSSLGGAVGVELLRYGSWKGPVVLLAPAQHKVAGLARLPPPRLPQAVRCLIVHGTSDDVVPVADSRALVREAGPHTSLLEVEDDHRLNQTATAANLAAWLARVLAVSNGAAAGLGGRQRKAADGKETDALLDHRSDSGLG